MSGEDYVYQILLLGAKDAREVEFQKALTLRANELGLPLGSFGIIRPTLTDLWSSTLPSMAIFWGAEGVGSDPSLLSKLEEDSVVVVPVVSNVERVEFEIPERLRNINALVVSDAGVGIDRLVSLVFEKFQLLRKQRRLFISYKRLDSQAIADEIYDALDARGFDVFIDVRSVPPAVDFQSELWHRMSDSDVLVLIDTPNFRSSRWAMDELTRANATNIQILHLLWPGQSEDPQSPFSHYFQLETSDILGSSALAAQGLRTSTLEKICGSVEQLRARAMAFRHNYLVDSFCDASRDLGLTPTIQTTGAIELSGPGSKKLIVVPTVGVPTSDRIANSFEAHSGQAQQAIEFWAIYDNRGLLNDWLAHMRWLNKHLPPKCLNMAEAPAALKDWTEGA